MALTFNGIEPVGFGPEGKRRICAPKLNAELRLRVARLQFKTDQDLTEADSILADCFPDDREFVYEFLRDEMTPFDKQTLQTFLLSGIKAVEQMANSIDTATEKFVEEMVVKELKKATEKAEGKE